MIFSGDKSKELWNTINNIGNLDLNKPTIFKDIWHAMYFLGCKCQELETKLEELKKKNSK